MLARGSTRKVEEELTGRANLVVLIPFYKFKLLNFSSIDVWSPNIETSFLKLKIFCYHISDLTMIFEKKQYIKTKIV